MAESTNPGATPDVTPRAAWSRRRWLATAAAAPWLALGRARADEAAWPSRPLRIIVPNAVGGTSDLLARLVGRRLSDELGVPVAVENRPGAAGRIALEFVARAAADGHTLLLGNNGTNAVAGGAAADDVDVTALTPIIRLTSVAIVVAAIPPFGVDSLPALIARAREAPGRLAYASGGIGSTSHLAALMLSRRAGIEMVQIPYAGTASAIKDVLAGLVPVVFTQFATIAPHLKGGQLVALAVTSARRVAAFPDVPTIAEKSFPGFDVTTWHGLLAPPATPADLVTRLNRVLARIVGAPSVQDQLAALGMEPAATTPAQFAAEIRTDRERWNLVSREPVTKTR